MMICDDLICHNSYIILYYINALVLIMCWIGRNLNSREDLEREDLDVKKKTRIYKNLIRPHFEYCAKLWNPAAEHGNWSFILRIESVQKIEIEEVDPLSYSKRLLPGSSWLYLFTTSERERRSDERGARSPAKRLQILGLTTLAERRSRVVT